VPHTHPELLAADELTVGIRAQEYANRRAALAKIMPPGSVAVLPAASTTYMAGIIPYTYRQDADFLYCTGIHQHAVAVIQAPGTATQSRPKFTLFIEHASAERDRWDGARLDQAAALEAFGADEVYYTSELSRRVYDMCRAAPSGMLFDVDRTSSFLYSIVRTALDQLQSDAQGHKSSNQSPQPFPLNPLRPLLHHLRLRKSPAEMELMRRSAAVAAQAMAACIRSTRPGLTEWDIEVEFEHQCKRAGARRMAYPPVVAPGPDSCIIHYARNDKVLREGQLLLVDAGCELNGYASDVTRTWPISGRFSTPQRQVYDMVLEVHRRCISACKPGSSIRELHALSVRLISEALHDLGLCGNASVKDIAINHYRSFYWHSLGHWLGMDTHDTHLVGYDRKLEPGHVITVEPGLYVPDEERYGEYRGIGVRIEDDVLITPGGCEVLSAAVPTDPRAVEELVLSGRGSSRSSRQ